MGTSVLKEKLHGFVENGDDKLLKMLYAVATEYTDEDTYVFTDEEIEEFERRSTSLLSGTSKGYTWEEAKKIITGK